ncbi:MAG: CDP-glycerol glycerophosphotransferase family protein [Sporolactobacillus sp.]
MIKELLISAYLLAFRLLFSAFTLLPLRRKVVFVTSFSENPLFVARALQAEDKSVKIVFLCRGACLSTCRQAHVQSFPIETLNPVDFSRAAFHLATGRVIVVDNYYGFLAAARFRGRVRCVQLWHAVGAFKTFGLGDRSVASRPLRARRRFVRVYRHFDKIAVGSDAMSRLFSSSFGLDDAHMLRTGVPRTDFFFDRARAGRVFRAAHRLSGGRKIILYAPTFRDWHKQAELPFHMQEMADRLSATHVLVLKFHPAVSRSLAFHAVNGFAVNCSDRSIQTLMLAADLLITDYSSLPFEFALLDRPILFFAYDLEDYAAKRGLVDDYREEIPGPLVCQTADLIAAVLAAPVKSDAVRRFSQKWNAYSKGASSSNVAHYIAACLNGTCDNNK